jgi:hypothetical protein
LIYNLYSRSIKSIQKFHADRNPAPHKPVHITSDLAGLRPATFPPQNPAIPPERLFIQPVVANYRSDMAIAAGTTKPRQFANSLTQADDDAAEPFEFIKKELAGACVFMGHRARR